MSEGKRGWRFKRAMTALRYFIQPSAGAIHDVGVLAVILSRLERLVEAGSLNRARK